MGLGLRLRALFFDPDIVRDLCGARCRSLDFRRQFFRFDQLSFKPSVQCFAFRLKSLGFGNPFFGLAFRITKFLVQQIDLLLHDFVALKRRHD